MLFPLVLFGALMISVAQRAKGVGGPAFVELRRTTHGSYPQTCPESIVSLLHKPLYISALNDQVLCLVT